MRLLTLVTTYKKSESEILSLITTNNLQGDVFVGNQCGKDERKDLGQVGKADVTLYSFSSIGLSNNRNALLLQADADVITFADDDLIFCDNYPALVLNDFQRKNLCQVIRYNVISLNKARPICQVNQEKEVGFAGISKYGMWGFFIQKDFLLQHHLAFRPELGPGQSLSHGEDTVFLKDLVDQKAAICQMPLVIATTPMVNSSWYGKDIANDIITDGYCYRLIRKKKALLYGLNRYRQHQDYYPGYSLKQFLALFKRGIRLADQAHRR